LKLYPAGHLIGCSLIFILFIVVKSYLAVSF
jgi:hypothetical protein